MFKIFKHGHISVSLLYAQDFRVDIQVLLLSSLHFIFLFRFLENRHTLLVLYILFLRFMVNRRIFVVGFGLYGSIHGPTEYQVNIQVSKSFA